MSAIDYKSSLFQNAITYLTANSALIGANGAFKPNCFLKDDVREPTKTAMGVGLNDYPKISLRITDDTPISRNPPHTFGMNSVNYTASVVDVPVPCSCKLICEMRFMKESYQRVTRFAADALVRVTWLAHYPKFGLAYCQTFTVDEKRKDEKLTGDGTTSPVWLVVITQTLTFSLRPYLSQLIAS